MEISAIIPTTKMTMVLKYLFQEGVGKSVGGFTFALILVTASPNTSGPLLG
jgi:hypothetical protein